MLKLRKTEEADLDFVLEAEHHNENLQYVIPWPRARHLQALFDPDLVHLIVEREHRLGYVILAGLLDPNHSIEFRRLVITEKGRGHGKATVGAASTTRSSWGGSTLDNCCLRRTPGRPLDFLKCSARFGSWRGRERARRSTVPIRILQSQKASRLLCAD